MRIQSKIAVVFISSIFPLFAALSGFVRDQDPAKSIASESTGAAPPSAARGAAKRRPEPSSVYERWLNEDVVYIITDEERKAFQALSKDVDREHFIEAFWLRRDPTPDTVENEFKEEHYRRIAFANEQFASGIPGWRTDRGRVYIKYGPWDENEKRPSGRTPTDGQTASHPVEIWRYRYISGLGENVDFEFVDEDGTGDYRLTADSRPNAMRTFTAVDDGVHRTPPHPEMRDFEKLERMVQPAKVPVAKFTDLEAAVDSRITQSVLPMLARVDYLPATSTSTMTDVTLEFERRDLQFVQSAEISTATIRLYARITTGARRVANVFEDIVELQAPNALLAQAREGRTLYQKSVPLAPGHYQLDIVAKDAASGAMNHYRRPLDVPSIDAERVSASSLVLADILEMASMQYLVRRQFVIGTNVVRPRVDRSFKRSEKLGIFQVIYNAGFDETKHKVSGDVLYEISKADDKTIIASLSDDLAFYDGSASQVTITKLLNLGGFDPGKYVLSVKVDDKTKGQAVVSSAEFTVTP
jgi:GWxTD domain-containing protein